MPFNVKGMETKYDAPWKVSTKKKVDVHDNKNRLQASDLNVNVKTINYNENNMIRN